MKQRILAVDDEPDMLRLIKRIITEMTPYEIITTNNPLEVPRILDDETFDVVLLDLKMPGLGGLDIFRMMNEQGRSELGIIITAFGSLETAVEAISLGIFDYITKPFKKERIISSLDRAMNLLKAKKYSAIQDSLFETEPFDSAIEIFTKEYINRLARRFGGDIGLMALASGIGEDVIKSELEN